MTPADAAHAGLNLGSLVQLVGQLDEHIPFLTVRQTLEFAHGNAAVDPVAATLAAGGSAADLPAGAAEAHGKAVEDILSLLHLHICADTVIGNDLLRGVSGGEKKRVTVGEGLLTNARFLALDEISNGLDSAVTFNVVAQLKARAAEGNSAIVMSLLQPGPEIWALFDEVILLREGAVV
jgi:ABC-type multidrug transport system ATPase subunit